MGTLSNLIEFVPVNNTPPGALNNPQTHEIFRPARQYAEPSNFTFYPPFGPFTVGGVHEISGRQFLAGYWQYQSNNNQIVSVPERPVDMGTFQAIVKSNLAYTQPTSGIYLQGRTRTNGHVVAGEAPNQGIYTGFGYGDEGA